MRVLLASVAGFFAIEALIFHGLYGYIISPDSSAGTYQTIFRNEQLRVKKDRNQVVTVGDSRMDFYPRYADEIKSEVGYSFGKLSCPGTTPRDWYYILRQADPKHNRYAAIVIPVEDYDDAETWEDHANRLLDLHYLVPWLRVTDIPEFSGSFHTRSLRFQAALGILFKGYTYRADFQDFIRKPRARWDYVRLSRRDAIHWNYDYAGEASDVTGVKIDFAKRTLTVPANYTPDQKALFQSRYLDPWPPDKGQWSAYLKYWFGKIYDMYRGSGTRIVFIHLPWGPYPRPNPVPYRANSSVREMASRPGVILDQEHDFDSLQDPRNFFDPMHMNARGNALFSRMLARRVRELLGPPAAD